MFFPELRCLPESLPAENYISVRPRAGPLAYRLAAPAKSAIPFSVFELSVRGHFAALLAFPVLVVR